MDHNRRGLALMLAALLFTILAVSIRSCNDTQASRISDLDRANQQLIDDCYSFTRPIRDYRILLIDNGMMTVDAGPTLGVDQIKALAKELTQALYNADHVIIHSELVMVDIQQNGKVVCSASTSASGIWVKLRE